MYLNKIMKKKRKINYCPQEDVKFVLIAYAHILNIVNQIVIEINAKK